MSRRKNGVTFVVFFTCAVDPVDVDVDGGPSEHGDDVIGVLLFDGLLEDDLIGEANATFTRILPGENARTTTHLQRLKI